MDQPHKRLDELLFCGYNTSSIVKDANRLYPAEPEGHWRT